MVSRETSAPPAAAAELFGDRLPTAVAYADALATTGVRWGLIGPREVDRIWERHILNCAVIGELIPPGVVVVDIGSGAGLPGIPLALARPDLTIHLVEPAQRRVTWLELITTELSLAVTVVRSRAEDADVTGDVVTSRALAPVGRLLRWSLPLVREGGRVVALKGQHVADEIAGAAPELAALGDPRVRVHQCGRGILAESATVMTVEPLRRRHRKPGRPNQSSGGPNQKPGRLNQKPGRQRSKGDR